MRRVLIVSPNFPPVNAPDMQRVRMALPYLAENGWQASILAITPEEADGFLDRSLSRTVPDSIDITYSGALPRSLTRHLGWRTAGRRALPFLRKVGDRLIRTIKPDVVFISTTVFPAMTLGARWLQRFGVPYVLDYQDPWITDYYDKPGAPDPPGGWWKYRLARRFAARQEPPVVRNASHIVCVSDAYPAMLKKRYTGLADDLFTVLPFGAPENDFALVSDSTDIRQNIFDPVDGVTHFVYLGVLGPGFDCALRVLFGALGGIVQDDSSLRMKLRVHFVGTNYGRGSDTRDRALPMAREFGVADMVTERRERIPYLEGVALLQSAHGILLLGTDDPTYNASKLFPCLLANRPILPIVHESSALRHALTNAKGPEPVAINPEQWQDCLAETAEKLSRIINYPEHAASPGWRIPEENTARGMTRRLAEIFERSLGKANPKHP